MSREERVELLKKERSQTSGRLLRSGEDRGHLTSARSKTSGRDVERRIKDQAWTTSVKRDRSPVDWKLSDRGGRYQVTYLYESLQTTILNRRRGNDSEVMSAGMMRELLPEADSDVTILLPGVSSACEEMLLCFLYFGR